MTRVALLLLLAVARLAPAMPTIGGVDLVTGAAAAIPAKGGAVAVVFLSSVCPCSKSHEPVLAALSREFPEVRFVGLHANAEEDASAAREHFRAAALPFPTLRDDGGRLARELGALKTPHVFVFASSGELVYGGGVDDSEDAKRATTPLLRNALRALRAGKAPDPARTRPLGCVIEVPGR